MKKREFGELEYTIVQLIEKKKMASVSDIHSFFKNEVAYTTVMTVMNRLFEKSILNRKKEKRSYIYWINNNYKSDSLNIFKRLKEKIFSGSSIEMVSYLIKNFDITSEELEKIDELIKKEKKR